MRGHALIITTKGADRGKAGEAYSASLRRVEWNPSSSTTWLSRIPGAKRKLKHGPRGKWCRRRRRRLFSNIGITYRKCGGSGILVPFITGTQRRSLNFSPSIEYVRPSPAIIVRYWISIGSIRRENSRVHARARLRSLRHTAPHRIRSHVNCIGKRGYVVHIYPFAVVNVHSLRSEANVFPIAGVIIFPRSYTRDNLYFPTNYELIPIIRSGLLTRVYSTRQVWRRRLLARN